MRDQLAEILEIDDDEHHVDATFADDLDADSLALIELVEALEEELGERTVGFRVDDEDLDDLATVRDAVDYVVLGSDDELRPEGRARRCRRGRSPLRSAPAGGRSATNRARRGADAPLVVRRARRTSRRTNGSSSSATPCSASS